MSSSPTARLMHGGCHCGAVRIEFSASQAPESLNPRACDCDFCQKHGAAYVSDTAGQLCIIAADPNALRLYRQGSMSALFQLCSRCGVLLAVTFEHDDRVYGAINARCLEEHERFGATVAVSPQQLSAAEKVDRWRQVWIPDVRAVNEC